MVLEPAPLLEIGCWKCGRTAKPPPFGYEKLLQLNPAMNLSCFVAGSKLDIIQFRQPDMPDIGLVLQLGNSIFTGWQVGKLESFEFRLDRFFGLPNTAWALAGRGDVLQPAAGAAPLMALDLRQGGLRSVVRPRRWDGPKTTKTTATRIAECDLAASEAGDGNAKGSGNIQVIFGGFWCFFFAFGFWNMLENAIVLLTPIGDEWWEAKVLEMSETSPYPRAEPVGATLPRCVIWQCPIHHCFWCRVVECRLLKNTGLNMKYR